MPLRIEGNRPVGERVLTRSRQPLCPPEQRAHPGNQLVWAERLCEVIIGANLEPKMRSDSSARAVSMMTGNDAVALFARTTRHTSRPSTWQHQIQHKKIGWTL